MNPIELSWASGALLLAIWAVVLWLFRRSRKGEWCYCDCPRCMQPDAACCLDKVRPGDWPARAEREGRQ